MMRKNIAWALVVVVTALIQMTWLKAVNVRGALPNLSLLLVVYFALSDGEERAMWTGALCGLFQDVIGTVTLGHHVLSLVIVGYVFGRLSTRLVTDHPAVVAALVFCGSLMNGIAYTFIEYVQHPTFSALGAIAGREIPNAFYTAIVTPVLFFLLDRVFRREPAPQNLGKRPEKRPREVVGRETEP